MPALGLQRARPAIGSQVFAVTASVGVALRLAGQASLRAIQAQAGEAMFQAKKAGRNPVSILSAAGAAQLPEGLLGSGA